MTNIDAAAARMIRTRRVAERAAGKLLVEMIEAGAPISAMLTDAGTVYGTDRDPRSLIHFAGVAKARRSAALAKIA
jgi:hypothetical protein